jgi:hypothetical protein
MEVVMQRLKAVVVLIFMLCCVGVTPGFAMKGVPSPQQSEVQKELHATSPTPATLYMNVEGKLKEIQGDLFILEVSQKDQPIQVRVGKDTAFPNGQKVLGQPVQALVSTQDGHALIIR